MPRLQNAMTILRERGPVGLTKETIEWTARTLGVGVSFGSNRPATIGGAKEPDDATRVFERIYQDNFWNSSESTSGPGSELERTTEYRRQLIAFLTDERIGSFFDAPCGDLNWIGEVIDMTGIAYIGGDISPTAIEQAKGRRPELDLRVFDLCADTFPDVDVWHCRDCLFHLSFADIRRAFERFAQSNVPYALMTTNKALYLQNADIDTGGHRHLDLERHPVNLPRPVRYLSDFRRGTEFPRYIGVWRREQIASVL